MIEKIISGGQTGADIAGLIAAKKFGIKTGGWMPNGFLTQCGPRPEWAKEYDLEEHDSYRYTPRTYANVRDSDATIRLAFDLNSAGEICTLKAIHQYKKPHIDVDLASPRSVEEVAKFIAMHNIKVLNVAGNSELTYNGICGEVIEYLTKLFEHLGFTNGHGQGKGNTD